MPFTSLATDLEILNRTKKDQSYNSKNTVLHALPKQIDYPLRYMTNHFSF